MATPGLTLHELITGATPAQTRNGDNSKDRHQNRPQTTKTNPPTRLTEFPAVIRLVKNKLGEQNLRGLSENVDKTRSLSSLSLSPGLFGEEILQLMNVSEQRHTHLLVQNVDEVDFLIGEELCRKSPDGCLETTGRKLEIPQNFNGWFEILSQDGRSSKQVTEVSSLVYKHISHFIVTRPLAALKKIPLSSLGQLTTSSATTAHTTTSGYSPTTLVVGQSLKTVDVVKLGNGFQYLSCRLIKKDLKEVKENEEIEILLSLKSQGRFLPISRDANLTDAHDAGFLLTKLRMPVVVRVYWPADERNIPPSPNTSQLAPSKKINKNKNMKNNINILNVANSSTIHDSGELLTNAILRIQGHHTQKVIYVAPLLPSHVTDSSAASAGKEKTNITGNDELQMLAVRLQAGKFFDVLAAKDVLLKPQISEICEKKLYSVRSSFKKEINIFDPTVYKLTNEKIVINKQPITSNGDKPSNNDVQLRHREPRPTTTQQQQQELVGRRRSLPLDVAMLATSNEERKDGASGDDDDLMDEIEDIYVRVRYLDRSVRYPLPQGSSQKGTKVSQQQNRQAQLSQHSRPLVQANVQQQKQTTKPQQSSQQQSPNHQIRLRHCNQISFPPQQSPQHFQQLRRSQRSKSQHILQQTFQNFPPPQSQAGKNHLLKSDNLKISYMVTRPLPQLPSQPPKPQQLPKPQQPPTSQEQPVQQPPIPQPPIPQQPAQQPPIPQQLTTQQLSKQQPRPRPQQQPTQIPQQLPVQQLPVQQLPKPQHQPAQQPPIPIPQQQPAQQPPIPQQLTTQQLSKQQPRPRTQQQPTQIPQQLPVQQPAKPQQQPPITQRLPTQQPANQKQPKKLIQPIPQQSIHSTASTAEATSSKQQSRRLLTKEAIHDQPEKAQSKPNIEVPTAGANARIKEAAAAKAAASSDTSVMVTSNVKVEEKSPRKSIYDVLKKLTGKNKGSMDISRPAQSEFSYRDMQGL